MGRTGEPRSRGGDVLELELESLAFGGDAVGRDAGGRVVFVSGGAPGDRVEVTLTEEKRAFARGVVRRVLRPGRRVEPPCQLAGRCGGCPWMHVDKEAQAEAKQAIVARALERSGAVVAPIWTAPASLGYRRRAKLTARSGRIGFLGRRSHEVVDVPTCPALEPALDTALNAARRALGPLVGEGGTIAGLAGDDGVHLAVDAGAALGAGALQAAAESLVGQAGIVGVVLGGQAGARSCGAGSVLLEDLPASAAGFAQANRAQNLRLREQVRSWAREHAQGADRLLELYAGDGNFTRDLARGGEVDAVEADPQAAARLQAFITATPQAHAVTVTAAPAEHAVAARVSAGARYGTVVLDPPRAGAAEVVRQLARLEPGRIVYVSCDPMTLQRDLAILTTGGHRAVHAQPIDFMPHTSHIEVVVLLDLA